MGALCLGDFCLFFFLIFPWRKRLETTSFMTQKEWQTLSATQPPPPPPKKGERSLSITIKARTPSCVYSKKRIKRYIITKGFSLDSRSDTMMNASLKGNIFVSFKSLATPTVLIHPCDKGSSESYFTIFIISQERENTCGSSPQSATHQVYKWQQKTNASVFKH